MKAASKFKRLLNRKRPQFTSSILGEPNVLSEPPEEIDAALVRSQSDNLANRKAVESQLVSDGITRDIEVDGMLHTIHGKYSEDDIKNLAKGPVTLPISDRPSRAHTFPSHAHSSGGGTPTGYNPSRSESGKGQAHDPLEDSLFLNIGSSSDNPELPPGSPPVVSESPSAVEDNVYEKAYEQEIQRILKSKAEGRSPTIYLTKRVEKVAHLRDHKDITDFSRAQSLKHVPKIGFAALADIAKKHVEAHRKEPKAQDDAGPSSSHDAGK
jgi:calcium/calmodulin-dependent protein kinase kinase 2